MVLNMVTVEAVARYRARLEDEAAAAGRPTPTLAVWVVAAAEPTQETLAQLAAAKVGYYAMPGYAEMFADAGFGDLVALARSGAHPREVLAATPPEIEQAIALVGAPDRLAERLKAYFAAGADEVCVVPATAGDDGADRTLRALAEVAADAG
jgi:alkanesulfonate monooxygenase SsuD/methylene tetrahydromethanopterin reductase-like flavin-dependent oxidoreductase (luciferase family)